MAIDALVRKSTCCGIIFEYVPFVTINCSNYYVAMVRGEKMDVCSLQSCSSAIIVYKISINFVVFQFSFLISLCL